MDIERKQEFGVIRRSLDFWAGMETRIITRSLRAITILGCRGFALGFGLANVDNHIGSFHEMLDQKVSSQETHHFNFAMNFHDGGTLWTTDV